MSKEEEEEEVKWFIISDFVFRGMFVVRNMQSRKIYSIQLTLDLNAIFSPRPA
jgi:hypothetical protein